MDYYSSDDPEEDLADWLASQAAAVGADAATQ